VIPVLNGAETIVACLDAVLTAARSWEAPVSVVVMDNGSTDATVSLVRSQYPEQVLIIEEPAGTVAALRNLGASHHQSDLLSFVDADCVVCSDYFTIAWRALETSGADAVGCSYALPPHPGWIERAWHVLHQPSAAGPAEWLYAGNFVTRREAFARVGGFNESLITGEDPELGRRLRNAGARLHCDPALKSVHLGNPRTVGAFFEQQRWHGLGAFEPGTGWWSNRPLLMTLLHGLLSLAMVGALALGLLRSAGPIAAGLAASQLFVPLLTVVFRLRQTRRWSNPIPGAILYWLYYWARLAAFASIAVGIPRASRGRPSRPARTISRPR
jgi:glycosyltransferase involved in cell wall biosynthesis